MDNERYKRIKESIPSSIVMAMEHIRRYLVDGKASVMVGAGFSKNAVKPDYVDMKDWNSLGKLSSACCILMILNRMNWNLKPPFA